MDQDEAQDFRGTSRFYLERRLGAGGMGIVYRAHDRERDEHVALKLLSKLKPAELYRFKREFRTLADVVHPNLVVLYELLAEKEHWFFTMELVVGLDFLSYVRDGAPSRDEPDGEEVARTFAVALTTAPDTETVTTTGPDREQLEPQGPVRVRSTATGAVNVERLRLASRQLAAALIKIHQTGHLHRDIKPSNILVTPAGRVVVLDFGVISELSASRGRHEPHEIAGTPAYQAPELLREGYVATAASDWYSFGVMLYEALVGWRPFAHYADKKQRAAARAMHAFASPAELRPDVPPDLSQLCVDLLRSDPAVRPSGEQVLLRLGSDRVPSIITGEHRPSLAGIDTGTSTPVVGREHELEALRAAFARVRAGRGQTVFLRGLSGMGKSTLAARFLDELDEALVFEGRCYERESLPYKALDSVVDALCGYLAQQPDAWLLQVLPPDVVALGRVFPVLRRVPAIGAAVSAEARHAGTSELRRRAFSALRALLAQLGASKPLVLYVDDLQWGDAESALLFFELMRPPTPRILVLGTYRSEEAHGSALLGRLLAREEQHEPFHERLLEIDIDKLPPAIAVDFAHQQLDKLGAVGDLAERVAKESAGNPYFLRELVRYITSDDHTALEGLTLEAVILDRYGRLSRAAQDLLQVVAVAGWRLLQSVAMEAAGVESEGQRVMAELRAAHLVRTDGIGERGRIETYHDRVREALSGTLELSMQRQWHGRLFRALEASSEVAREEHIYPLAHHAYQAGYANDPQRALALNLRAGRMARDSHAYEQAFSYLAQAAEVAERAGLAIDDDFDQLFGHVAASAGRIATAVQCFERALSHAAGEQQRAALHYALARIHVGRMDLAAARRATGEALVAIGRPPVRGGAGGALATARAWLRGRGAEKNEAIFGSAKAEERELLRLEVGLYKYTTMIELFALQPLKLLESVTRSYEPAVRLGLSPEYVELYVTGAAVCGVRRLRWGPALERRARELSEELGDPVTTARTKLYLAISAHGLGKTQLADETAEDCLKNHGTWLENVDFLTGVADLCWNLNMRGFAARSWHWVQQGLQRATLTESNSAFADGHSYRTYAGPALTMLDRFEEAVALLESFRAQLRPAHEDEWRWGQYLAHHALALVLQGDVGDAFEQVVAARQAMKLAVRRLPLQLMQFFVAQAWGRLEQLRRAPREARAAARRATQRALKQLRRVSQQETLQAHLAAVEGGFWAEEDDQPRSLASLERAEALARRTDNPWVKAECAQIRARLARARGDLDGARQSAAAAWCFAHNTGWRVRAAAIAAEFELSNPADADPAVCGEAQQPAP